MFWWWVFSLIAIKEAFEGFVVLLCSWFVAGAGATFQFEGRADGSKCNLNRLHLDASALGKFTRSNSAGKDSQGGDLLGWGFCGKHGVHVTLFAVFLPMIPEALPFDVTCRHDAIVHGSVKSIAMTLETVAEFRRNSRQD